MSCLALESVIDLCCEMLNLEPFEKKFGLTASDLKSDIFCFLVI